MSSEDKQGAESDFPEVSALLEKQGARIDSERRGQSAEAQFGILLELYREMAEKAKSLEQRLTRSSCAARDAALEEAAARCDSFARSALEVADEALKAGELHRRSSANLQGLAAQSCADFIRDMKGAPVPESGRTVPPTLPIKQADPEATNPPLERPDFCIAEWTKAARREGRAEALNLILNSEAETFCDDHTYNSPIADTGDFSLQWDRKKLAETLDVGEDESVVDRLDGLYWNQAARIMELEEQLARQAKASASSASAAITREKLESLPHAAYGSLNGWTAHYVPVESVLSALSSSAEITDEQIEKLIENSDGHWREDTFRIDGPSLTALLRAAASLTRSATAPSGSDNSPRSDKT